VEDSQAGGYREWPPVTWRGWALVDEGVAASMSADADNPDGALVALYRLPLAEFVAARDQLARRLRTAGDRDAARRVAGLRRPSISAWAANQLAQVAPSAMAELLDAGAALTQAQHDALAGHPAPRVGCGPLAPTSGRRSPG
jgi:hypothetical protein